MNELKPFTPIARTNWRNQNQLFGIKPLDRNNHLLVLGASGMGKTTLLINMAMDDIYKGNSVCVIEPHGDAIKTILGKIPEYRRKDVVFFDATNLNALPAYNPLHNVPSELRQLVASEMVLTLKKLFSDNWGPKLEYLLRFAILSLLQYPSSTLLDIHALFMDKDFRSKVLENITDKHILDFWRTEYALYSSSAQASSILPILNKIGIFLANDILRGIFGQRESISIPQCMDENKILLCNISKGIIGHDISAILGGFLLTSIQISAMRRANASEEDRKQFHLFIDEASNYMSDSFSNMLSEIRKYKVSLFISTQFLSQLDLEIKNAVLANVGSKIIFRVGMEDAKLMEKEFHPVFDYEDFINLPKYHVYVRLMIDGGVCRGFSAVTSIEH